MSTRSLASSSLIALLSLAACDSGRGVCAGDLTNALKDALGKLTAACEAFTVL